jgi:hypothetical protein
MAALPHALLLGRCHASLTVLAIVEIRGSRDRSGRSLCFPYLFHFIVAFELLLSKSQAWSSFALRSREHKLCDSHHDPRIKFGSYKLLHRIVSTMLPAHQHRFEPEKFPGMLERTQDVATVL